MNVIRKTGKKIFDLLYNEQIKRNLLQAIPFWIASFLTALVAVGFTKLFNSSENILRNILAWNRWSIFVLAPVCFFLAWFFIQRYAKNARGSGIPQVMAAIELSGPKYNYAIDKLLSLKIILFKILSCLLMVIGGGVVGREGPTIQIAGSVFRVVNKWIPESWPKLSGQSFILTGGAAGLAAAFNTPLGGVVFAIEELAKIHVRFFRTALFSAVIIAGLTAQGLLGPYLYLGYPDVSNLKLSTFFGVALTAALAGIGGSLMGKLTLSLMKWKRSFGKIKSVSYVILSGLVFALIAYFISPDILGSGKDIINSFLFTENKQGGWDTTLLRMAGPIISFNTGAAGGVFAPALATGASVGAYVSNLFDIVNSNANILILSGMVGFLTGITRTPFTSAILVLEMTDRHSVIFHLMLAAMISNVAALVVDRRSFYERLKKGFVDEIIAEKAREDVAK
jgi:H+/Cl- antiporter ClcA